MTNMKATKRALVSSALALFLCFAMLLGTTYAWFTDEVSSANNIIQTGTLDIEMWYGDAADNLTEVDETTPAIFNYQYWEPGYTEVKYVQIKNVGSLALKYQLNIVPNELPVKGEPNLADVIDVYLFAADATIDRAAIAAATPVGTLSDLIADRDGAAYGVLLPAEGVGAKDVNSDNAPRGEITYCIVLKMQEDAGNEYQDLSVGEGFSLQLMATQYTWENDSFDHTYDDGADFPPKADVTVDKPINVPATMGMNGPVIDGGLDLNAKFTFKTTETAEEAEASPYKLWHADFVVTSDGDIPAGGAALAGYYSAYCDDYNNGNWVALADDTNVIAAGTELLLLYLMLNGGSMNYAELCQWVPVFECGVADLSNGALAGTTLTVELRIYEVGAQGDCDNGGGCKHPTVDCETGEYVTIGTYSYTFPAVKVTNDAELEAAIANGVTAISLADGTYHMPAVAQGKTLTISGSNDAIIEVVPGGQSEANGQLDYNLDGSTVTFNGVTIKTNSQLYAGYARLSATYNNCVIQNTYNLGVGTSEFNNCVFNITNEYLRVGGATSATFNGCTFNTDGRAILVFQDGTNVAQTVVVKDCTFNATAAANTWNGIHVAAVSYDGSQGGTYTVTFEGNNVVDSDFNGLWQIKGGEDKVTVSGLN